MPLKIFTTVVDRYTLHLKLTKIFQHSNVGNMREVKFRSFFGDSIPVNNYS